jgi:tetratricopeptide (TPR) repeat protein
VNVRCPNCSAVFPVTAPPSSEPQQVECPLCLLRFQPVNEATVSVPAMPTQFRGSAAPLPDDEFESFGAPSQHTGIVRPMNPGGGFTGARPIAHGARDGATTTFPPAAPPIAPFASAHTASPPFDPPSSAVSPGGFADDNIDFEALLGDTLASSSAPAAPSPFGRVGTLRTGNTEAIHDPFDRVTAPAQVTPAEPTGLHLHGRPSFSARSTAADDASPPIAQPGWAIDDQDPFGVGPLQSAGGATRQSAGGASAQSAGDYPADGEFGGFGGFGDGPVAGQASGARTSGAVADDDGFGGFAGLDSSLDGRHASRDDDFIVVALTSGAEAPTRAAPARPQIKKRRVLVTPEIKQYLQRAATALVLLGLVVALVGAGLEVAGYGWFGRRLWAKPDAAAQRTAHSAKLAAAAHEPPTPLWDTRSTYETEIKRLDLLAKQYPRDEKIAQERVDRYLDFYERFPLRFGDSPGAKTGLEAALKLAPTPVRLEVIKTIAAGIKMEDDKLAELAGGTPDDQAVGARQALLALERKTAIDVLSKPGATGGGEVDAVRLAVKDSPELAELNTRMAVITLAAKDQPNLAKFKVLQAHMTDLAGAHTETLALVSEIVAKADDNAEARVLAASAHMETGNLVGADGLLRDAIDISETQKLPLDKRQAYLAQARLAAKRGDRDKLVASLQAAVDLQPGDEMTVVRLGRLLVAEKRADDARRILTAAKEAGMRSIAFEVALVEFWLYINRNEDALEELGEAGKLYPESLDLLFLRAQVEDKSAHFATARDLLAQVIQRDSKHLRAILRLGELLATAEKHDEALATLTAGRKALGDDESLLRLTVEELVALKRDQEAREIAGRLLEIAPDNHAYLLRAAQLDLRLGQVDRGLGYLRKLRDMRMLDRAAAYQMGLALQSKGKAEEGAATVLPFADQNESDVDLNVLAGQLLLDSHDIDRAAPVLQRAVTAANGKSPEAFFQFGRLAFARGENEVGLTRMNQAITAEPTMWRYRLVLAQNLFEAKHPENARELALHELEAIVSGAPAFKQAGRPVTEMHTVYGLLARHYSDQHRYPQAAQNWRKVVELKPDDLDALTSLGEALHKAASPDAAGVLRQVLKRSPSDARAALYLGLEELNLNHSAEALRALEVATTGGTPETAEAWYEIALIKRERGENGPALKAVEEYLKHAPKDATYRNDALTLRSALKANAQH